MFSNFCRSQTDLYIKYCSILGESKVYDTLIFPNIFDKKGNMDMNPIVILSDSSKSENYGSPSPRNQTLDYTVYYTKLWYSILYTNFALWTIVHEQSPTISDP